MKYDKRGNGKKEKKKKKKKEKEFIIYTNMKKYTNHNQIVFEFRKFLCDSIPQKKKKKKKEIKHCKETTTKEANIL